MKPLSASVCDRWVEKGHEYLGALVCEPALLLRDRRVRAARLVVGEGSSGARRQGGQRGGHQGAARTAKRRPQTFPRRASLRRNDQHLLGSLSRSSGGARGDRVLHPEGHRLGPARDFEDAARRGVPLDRAADAPGIRRHDARDRQVPRRRTGRASDRAYKGGRPVQAVR